MSIDFLDFRYFSTKLIYISITAKRQIGQMANLVNASEQSVNSMSDSTERANQSEQLSNHTYDVLSKIDNSISSVHDVTT